MIRQSGGFAAPRRKRRRSNGRERVWVCVREGEKSSRREISESSPAIPVRRIWTRVITANCSNYDDGEDDVTSLFFFSPRLFLSLVRLSLLWKIHREENLLLRAYSLEVVELVKCGNSISEIGLRFGSSCLSLLTEKSLV